MPDLKMTNTIESAIQQGSLLKVWSEHVIPKLPGCFRGSQLIRCGAPQARNGLRRIRSLAVQTKERLKERAILFGPNDQFILDELENVPMDAHQKIS